MAVDETWSDPSTGGTLANGTLTGVQLSETILHKVLSNQKHIGHVVGLAYTTFTPTLTQSGSVTVTVTSARYAVMGKTAFMHIALAVTGSGSAGQPIVIGSLPAAAAIASGVSFAAGQLLITDASAGTNYTGAPVVNGTGFAAIRHGGTGYIGSDPSFALASGDAVYLAAVYQTT